jgi:hypothetical protein
MPKMIVFALAVLVAMVLSGCAGTDQAGSLVAPGVDVEPGNTATGDEVVYRDSLYGKADICAKVNEQIRVDGTGTFAELLVATEAWETGSCTPPVIPASYSELHTACRQFLQETSVGGAMLDGTQQMPELNDTIHARAWALAMQGKLRGFTCRVGSWAYTF